MRKRMLRSVLVAAFSAVVAFGTMNGLSAAKGDTPTDVTSVTVAAAGPVGTAAQDGADDSVWD
jgi:hypothetical protein